MQHTTEYYRKAQEYLATADPVLAELIARYGDYGPRPHNNYYHELVSSIIGQQLSIKAAATIEKRFLALFDGILPTPEQILATDIEVLRSVGMSRSKASYVLDLAAHIARGELVVDRLPDLSNEEVMTELIAIKGIGEWTAHMFLIFALGRLDVLPVGDLGLRSAVRTLYGLEHLPTPQECRKIAADHRWHPYESVATWYLWRSLENQSA